MPKVKKIDINKVKKGIGNENKINLISFGSKKEKDSSLIDLQMEYYDMKTGKPLSLAQIEDRLKKNFSKMDQLSVKTMMDLYFIYCNWNTFYKRGDSFRDYLNKTLPISRSYAYDIIKYVDMMIKYRKTRGNVSHHATHLEKGEEFVNSEMLLAVARPIETVGMGKLKLISQVKNEKERYNLLDKVLKGAVITENEILRINKKMIDNIQRESFNDNVSVTKRGVKVDDTYIVEYSDGIDDSLRKDVSKAVKEAFRLHQSNTNTLVLDVETIEEKKEMNRFFKEIFKIKANGDEPFIVGVSNPEEKRAIKRFLEKYRLK